jgi:hypothetical protein
VITKPEWGGRSLSRPQALELIIRAKELTGGSHWHFNDCGCCITLHGADCAYLIGRDGESTFYASRGCSCGQEVDTA